MRLQDGMAARAAYVPSSDSLRGLLPFKPFKMLAQGAVDVGLVAAAVPGAGSEPCDDVRIQAQGYLPFDGAVEEPAAGVRPIEELGDVGCVDIMPTQRTRKYIRGRLFPLSGQFSDLRCM